MIGVADGLAFTDLNHFLDLPQDTPSPALRLAEHLSNIVRAATAGDAGTAWESALPCRRRPANRHCPGRMIVLRTEARAPIRWQCSVCDDEGAISNWEDSRPVTDEGVAVGGAFDSAMATGLMPIAYRVAGVRSFR